MDYTFLDIESCNMCGAESSNFDLLGKRLNASQGFRPQNKIGITTTVMKCKICGLVFSNPMPIPTDIQDHYGLPTEDYYVRDIKPYRDIKFENQEKINFENKVGKIHEGFRSLDIGAGLGEHMLKMKSLGVDAYGIEPSISFYNYAIDSLGLSVDKLQLAKIEEASFDENFFDYINFAVVLEHLYDPSAAIAKAIKWLKPGGKIEIEVPSSDWLISKLTNIMYRLRGLDYVVNLSPMHVPYHLYEFELKSFELNANRSEYEILSHEYFVCKTYLPTIFNFIVKPIMKLTNTGMEIKVWLGKPSLD